MQTLTKDTPIGDIEVSVKVHNLLKTHNFTTLGEAWAGLEHMKQYAKGWGSRCTRELTEVWQAMQAQQEDILKSPEFQAYLREDKLSSVQALLQEVDRRMLRVAIKGQVTGETRRHMAAMLRQAADYVEQLPAFGDK